MSPSLAMLVFVIGILGLFWLDRERDARVSVAVWLPLIWLLLCGSRMLSVWFNMAGQVSPDEVLEGTPLDRNVLTVFTMLGVAILFRRGERVRQIFQANLPVVVFFAYCLVSTVWSDYPFSAFKRWIKGCGDLVMVLIILTEDDPAAAIKRVLARFGFVLLPMSVLLIRYYGEIGRGFDTLTGKPTLRGVTTSKNLLGMICFISGLAAAWRLTQEFRQRVQPWRMRRMLAQAVLLAFALYLSLQCNSMTSLMCFLLAGCVLAASSLRMFEKRVGLVHLVVFLTLAVSFSVLFLNAGDALLRAIGRDPTLTGRTEIWDVALRFRGNAFFGTGFESFWLGDRLRTMWSLYWWRPNEAHNGYLELFLSVGLVGLLLFLVVVVAGYRNIIALYRRDPSLGRIKLSFFVATVAFNFTETAIRVLHPLWVIILLTALAVPDAEPVPVVAAEPVPVRPARRAALPLAAPAAAQRRAVPAPPVRRDPRRPVRGPRS